ncbi:hsp70 nucleotide exchange factor FES1-like [Triticum dicoccoides]|uniref:hsp70 nucleotide exchange factor FES1-like n=1 Tax=Triticum dicoccoides TaxID=85692 RepID=UPI00188FF69E|nr:hsp70 nucleotide exchange factor FES1-like [Triticum dicoccoides]
MQRPPRHISKIPSKQKKRRTLFPPHSCCSVAMAKARPHSGRSGHRRRNLLLAAALLSAALLLPAAMASAAVAAAAEGGGENRSRGAATQWATGKDEGELAAEREAAGGGSVVEDDFAGGFGSLDSMLQWAIGNSDPGRLKEEAADVQKLSEDELLKRRHEIKDLMEKLKMPSDADLMKIAIADLNNASISLEDRQRALQELLILVEPIDNANDLDKIGGLVPVIQDLNNANEEIRITSAWILGTASQNNALVQSQILGYGALARLVKMGYSTSAKEAAKAMYAISALIRNNVNGQEAFALENGNAMLQHILGSNGVDLRLQKKAVFLITDLADFQLNSGNSGLTFLSERVLLKSVTDMLSKFDLDLQEKVLLAIRSLLKLPSTDATDLESCGLDSVLYRLGVQLEELPSDEQKEYAGEVDALRREVEMLFQQKLKPGTATAAL